MPSYAEAQQLLWNNTAKGLYCRREGTYNYIWNHPSLNIRALNNPGGSTDRLRMFGGDIAKDMTPWHVGIWAENAAAYKSLQRISCFQPIGGTVSSGTDTWTVPDIVGLGTGTPGSLLGSDGPVSVQCPAWHEMTNPRKDLVSWFMSTKLETFHEDTTEHFLIDGPGGEIVTAVHASVDMKAIKLFTNRGRSYFFGEKDRPWWLEYQVEEGQMIVGLVGAFGHLGGWSWSAKMYSHWKLSGLGVLTIAEDC